MEKQLTQTHQHPPPRSHVMLMRRGGGVTHHNLPSDSPWQGRETQHGVGRVVDGELNGCRQSLVEVNYVLVDRASLGRLIFTQWHVVISYQDANVNKEISQAFPPDVRIKKVWVSFLSAVITASRPRAWWVFWILSFSWICINHLWNRLPEFCVFAFTAVVTMRRGPEWILSALFNSLTHFTVALLVFLTCTQTCWTVDVSVLVIVWFLCKHLSVIIWKLQNVPLKPTFITFS